MSRSPLVSITMSTRDRSQLLVERSIPSVLAQNHQRWELLVRGDGATAETEEAVRSFADTRITYRNLPHRQYSTPREQWCLGGAHALNQALEDARGDFVAHLDDDDEMLPNHLEDLLRFAAHQRANFVWGASYRQLPECWVLHGAPFADPQRGNPIVHSAILYSRRDFGDLRYDTEGAEPADFRMWKRLIERGAHHAYLPVPVAIHYAEGRQIERAAARPTSRERLRRLRICLTGRYRGWRVVPPPAAAARAAIARPLVSTNRKS